MFRPRSRVWSLLVLAVLLSNVAQHPASASRLLKEADASDFEDEEREAPVEPVSMMATFSSWPESLLSSYLSNEQLAAWSHDYISRCGRIARRFSIGKTVKGTDLWVIEVAANPGKIEAKPNFKYVSASLATGLLPTCSSGTLTTQQHSVNTPQSHLEMYCEPVACI
jgi:hypothetical protein